MNHWANPEENGQYQVKIVPIVAEYGIRKNFGYMHKWRPAPLNDMIYHVFTVAGLHPGFWDFFNQLMRQNPFDKWVNMADLAEARGTHFDIYDAKGRQFPKTKVWVMKTYDRLTLIAIEKLGALPVDPKLEMFFRVYRPSILIDTPQERKEGKEPNRFKYKTLIYTSVHEFRELVTHYLAWKKLPGFTGVYVNGKRYTKDLETAPPFNVADVIEIWHDPSVIRVETYQYSSLKDFYSILDKKRKVIVHPPKDKGNFKLNYFDDNDYFLLGKDGIGLYLHRNDVRTVRQLTHADVAISDDAIQNTSTYITELNNTKQLQVQVLIRETAWDKEWLHDAARIRYLYRLPDADILRAFTGARSNMEEWRADELEKGASLSFNRLQFRDISTEGAMGAVGYNASARALSEHLFKAEYVEGGRGIDIPITYRDLGTAWEYDEEGKLINFYNFSNSRHYTPVNKQCKLVEFTLGEAGRNLDITITNNTTEINPTFDYRVYTSGYSVDLQTIVGEMTDVTGNDEVYLIDNNHINWQKLDQVNQRGILISNKQILGYSFMIDHIDKSLSFDLTHIYHPGGLKSPVNFAQVDVWLNGHSLIDNVDWFMKGNSIYIHNKEFIVPGPQQITVRGYGISPKIGETLFETELGFVEGGVIGNFKRYNLRGDRPTRIVIAGKLYYSDDVPRAEREVPNQQWDELNGRPYMVKHVYCPIRYVRAHDNYPLKEEARTLDKKISDYLTKYLPKPSKKSDEITWEKGESYSMGSGNKPAIPNLQDKYRVFSPFMNVIVNTMVNNLLRLPKLIEEDGVSKYSDQDIYETIRRFTWWLEFDPTKKDFDQRYFAIMPYANHETLVVNSKELKFIKQINDTFLDSICIIEGHFEVNDNVRK